MPRKPSTTEGTPAITSMNGFKTSRNERGRPRPRRWRSRCRSALQQGRAQSYDQRAAEKRQQAKVLLDRVPALTRQVDEGNFAQRRQSISKQKMKIRPTTGWPNSRRHVRRGL